jgi:hypothetical protein
MIAPLLSIALSVSAVAPVDTTDRAKMVVRQAVHAVEGDSIAPVRAGWSIRLQRDSTDPGALLGLATLARLTYNYAISDRLYPQLFSADSVHPEPYAAYSRLGRAWSLEERGQSAAAGDEFARARRVAHTARDPAAEAEAVRCTPAPGGHVCSAPRPRSRRARREVGLGRAGTVARHTDRPGAQAAGISAREQ